IKGQVAANLSDQEKRRLQEHLWHPTPRLAEGALLQPLAHAAIDVSDGLIADLGHVLDSSQVGATVQLANLPLSNALKKLDKRLPYRFALSGGDDFELCFTIAPNKVAVLNREQVKLKSTFTCIGVVEPELGLRLVQADGKLYTQKRTGYRHF